MPIQAPQWTEFLSCPICCHEFDRCQRGPISLGCGHTVCRACLAKLQRNQCPYDQTIMRLELDQLPVNRALLSLVSASTSCPDRGDDDNDHMHDLPPVVPPAHAHSYFRAVKCIKDLALFLKPFAGPSGSSSSSVLSRPMQRKLVTLINCQLVEEEGRARAVRSARSLGERTVTELILQHQNHQQLSANLWAAVRARGCQFLGPAMQEEVLQLVLLALEDGSALSRKVLVMFVVQRLEPHFPQASKTSIGHVVQLLYRASCFKVSKRERDSSLMQLKEEFRTYDALRREHDAQIVQIATEAGLRIAPDQWSSLLYGDTIHKSHMQSIIDKLQTPQSFGQSVQELVIALQRTGDPGQLSSLRPQLELLASLDPSAEASPPDWDPCAGAMDAVKAVVTGLVHFIQNHGNRKMPDTHHQHNTKYKTSMCRDLTQKTGCPRGNNCTFAHSDDELEKYRSKSKKHSKGSPNISTSSIKQSETSHHQPSPSHYKSPHLPPSHMPSVLQLPPTSPADMPKPCKVTENGDKPYSMISKPIMMEEMIPQAPPPPFDGHGFVPVVPPPPPHTQPIPVLAAPPPPVAPTLVRPAMAPTPVYATPVAEYAYGAFPGQIFAQPGHPSQAMQQHPQGPPVFPSHPTAAIIPDIYNGNPQPLLVNQPVYNIVGPPAEFVAVAEPKQTTTTPKVSSWQDGQMQCPQEPSSSNIIHHHHNQHSNSTNNSTVTESNPVSTIVASITEFVSSRSLAQLKERKVEIMNQLETIVGKEATNEVAQQIANGEVPPLDSSSKNKLEFTSTYSIWTSGANFYSLAKASKNDWDPSKGYRTNNYHTSIASQDCMEEEDFIPFDPPIVSRFGPISRVSARPILRPTNAIQVSASNTTEPMTTPTVRRPVPAISPMPQVLYQQGYALGLMQFPNPLEVMNTVGHGIIDPPHLHMSQLEPSGVRPTDPVSDGSQVMQEERQRQQFNAIREGIDQLSLSQKEHEIRLKSELRVVIHGIEEKKKEMNISPNSQDDLDFEKNWKFDFDEEEKE